MGLNLSNGGDFVPHIRYMASTSSWTMSTEDGQKPVQFTQAIFDLENIETGWGLFVEAQAPEWVMDQSLSVKAAKPADDREWKRGFKVSVFSQNLFGNEPVREFATTATGAVMGISNLYDEYEAQKDENPGKVPVVEFQGSVPVKVGKGNTTVPTLKIVKWVDRPAELTGDAPAAAQQPQAQAQATTAVSEF